MATQSIGIPFEVFPDVDGDPLKNGYIYVGDAGLDPEVNPISVYWDEALSIPAAQPIRTINGFPSRNGSPGRVYCAVTNYSIRVNNKNGSLVYSELYATGRVRSGLPVVNSIAELASADATVAGEIYLSAGGRSGTFHWDGSDLSTEVAADTLQGVYITPASDPTGASGAWVRNLEGFVTPEMFGAEVGVDCRAAINAASAFRGRIRFMPRTYLISGTVYHYRGSFWSGAASVDTAEGRGTIIKKLGDVKMPMLQTERASGLGGGVSTHYYDMENILFNGNLDEQTEAHDCLQLWGMWIGSGIRNIFVVGHRGQAVTFAHGADVKVDRLWVQGIVCETGYAVNFNEPYDGTSTAGGIFYGGQIYIENISNKMGGDPRNVEADRGNALRINRVTVCNISDLHIEGARRLVDIESGQAVNITKLSYAHVGLSSDTDSGAVRYLDAGTKTTNISAFVGATGIALDKYVALADGLTSTLVEDVDIKSDSRGLPFTASFVSDTVQNQSKTRIGNALYLRRIGGSSSSEVRFESNDGIKYAYARQSGNDLFLGSNFNQSENVDFLSIKSFGNPADSVRIHVPVVLEDERDAANNISKGSVYRTSTSFVAGSGPAFQGITGTNSGVHMICTYQRGTAAPTTDADYIGQGFIDTANRNVYIAVDTGTGASDWVLIN